MQEEEGMVQGRIKDRRNGNRVVAKVRGNNLGKSVQGGNDETDSSNRNVILFDGVCLEQRQGIA